MHKGVKLKLLSLEFPLYDVPNTGRWRKLQSSVLKTSFHAWWHHMICDIMVPVIQKNFQKGGRKVKTKASLAIKTWNRGFCFPLYFMTITTFPQKRISLFPSGSPFQRKILQIQCPPTCFPINVEFFEIIPFQNFLSFILFITVSLKIVLIRKKISDVKIKRNWILSSMPVFIICKIYYYLFLNWWWMYVERFTAPYCTHSIFFGIISAFTKKEWINIQIVIQHKDIQLPKNV